MVLFPSRKYTYLFRTMCSSGRCAIQRYRRIVSRTTERFCKGRIASMRPTELIPRVSASLQHTRIQQFLLKDRSRDWLSVSGVLGSCWCAESPSDPSKESTCVFSGGAQTSAMLSECSPRSPIILYDTTRSPCVFRRRVSTDSVGLGD